MRHECKHLYNTITAPLSRGEGYTYTLEEISKEKYSLMLYLWGKQSR